MKYNQCFILIIISLLIIINISFSCKHDDEIRNIYPNNTPETVTDIDGNVYQTVKIGTQKWMLGNLKVRHYRNGDAITLCGDSIQWTTLPSEAYCLYRNDTSLVSTYGLLYNWYAATDARNIAPVGWRVPTEEDILTLSNYIGYPEGGKLKEVGTAHWRWPNKGADNLSKFTALPAGCAHGSYYSNGNCFAGLHEAAFFWTQGTYARALYLSWNNTYVFWDGLLTPSGGGSIRCIKE